MVRHLTSPSFIGREDELDALLELSRSSEPAVALVGGEAGVGKSRLVTELSRRAEADGALCLVGGCLEFGDHVLPLAPAVTILRSLAERVDSDTLGRVVGSSGSELSRLVPDLASEPAGGEPPASDRLFELFLRALHRLAGERSLVLVFEDLHWADGSSRTLFGFLARLLRAPVLLVGTYRSDELHRRHPLHPLLAEVRRTAHPEDIALKPFDRDGVSKLIEGVTDHPVDRRLAGEIHRRSGGNPFYAEELVAHGEASGAVSATLRDVVLARAASLGDDAFRLLCGVAAAGGVDDLAAVANVVGMPSEKAEELLPELTESGLFVADRTGWRFRHELAREVFEDQLPPGERTRVHVGLAEQLCASRPDQAGRISQHLWLAGDQPRTLEWSIKAARSAERLGASAEAQADYERALDVWDLIPDAVDRTRLTHADLLLATAVVAGRAGVYSRAIEYTRRAIDELSGDPVAEGRAWLQLVPLLYLDGGPGAQEAMAHALELIPATPPSVERVNALAWSGLVHLWLGRRTAALSASRDALDMTAELGGLDVAARRATAWARNVEAAAVAEHGEPAAADMMRRALDDAREVGDSGLIARGYVNLTQVLSSYGRYDEVLAVAADGEQELAELGERFGTGMLVTMNKQDALLRLGRWDEIEAGTVELHETHGVPALASANYAWVLLRRGRLAEARESFHAQARGVSDDTDWELLGSTTVGLVQLATLDRSWDEARRLVERALPMLLDSFPLVAAELVSTGIAAEAERTAVRPDVERAEARVVAGRWLGRIREAVQPFAGSALSAQLDAWLAQSAAEYCRIERRSAADQWTQVANAWEQLGRRYEVVYASLRAAEALLLEAGVADVDRRAHAADLLTRVHQDAEELSAAPIAEAAVALARQARLQLGGQAPAAGAVAEERPFDLTDREIQVLRLLAEGSTNGEIGATLFVSRKTASVHVSSILRKLGAANRVEAAAVAHRSGIIEGA